MDGVRNDVAQFQEFERTFMRDYGGVFADGKPSSYDALNWRGGVVPKSIKPATNSEVLSTLDLMRQERRAKTALPSLFAREIAVLAGGDSEEALMVWIEVLYVTHMLKNT